ncbi:MAG: hypothetical protein Q4B68_00105 [Bacteroidales bacterium]|nr:hypothetical protein [Bacteroidales bacterium]
MAIYSNKTICNELVRLFEEGRDQETVMSVALAMLMENRDPGESKKAEYSILTQAAKLLRQHEAFSESDIACYPSLERDRLFTNSFLVRISPIYNIEISYRECTLKFRVNSYYESERLIHCHTAESVVEWIVNHKLNADKLSQKVEDLMMEAMKELKKKKLRIIRARTLFEAAMKEFPDVKYECRERKRYLACRVYLPGTTIGAHINLWYGSYEKTLPADIDALRELIEMHSNCPIKSFFTYTKHSKYTPR